MDDEWEEIDTDGFSILSLSTDVADDDHDDKAIGGGGGSNQPTQTHDACIAPVGGDEGGDSPILGHATTRGSFETDMTLLPPAVSRPPELPEVCPSISKDVAVDKTDVERKSVEVQQGDPPPYPTDNQEDPAEAPYGIDRDTSAESRPPERQPAQTTPRVDYKDVEVNPADIHRLTTSTAKLVDGIISLTARLELQVFDRLRDLKPLCAKLRPQLKTLALITRAYARHWTQQQRQQQRHHLPGGGSWTTHGRDLGPAQGDVPVPLDPNLHDWLVRLHTAAEVTEQYMRLVLGAGNASRADDKETAHWAGMLAELAAQMEAFLPIIEADFAEFQTAHLTFQSLRDLESPPFRRDDERTYRQDRPSSRAGDSWAGSRPQIRPSSSSQFEPILLPTRRSDIAPESRPQQPPANAGINRLRRELYSLKDQLGHTLEELRQVRKRRSSLLTKPSSSPPISPADRASTNDAHKLLDDLSDELGNLKIVLERLLSNNPSEWLEDGITLAKEEEEDEGVHAKGKEKSVSHLTYAEFVSTSPEAVYIWRMELKEATTNTFLARCRVDSVSWNRDTGGSSRSAADEENWEAVMSKLQALRTIADVLIPMFVRVHGAGTGSSD